MKKFKLPNKRLLNQTLALVSKRSSKKVLDHFEKTYDKQGFERDSGQFVRWSKRKNSKNKKPLLKDSGRMRKSFQLKVKKRSFQIVNAVGYASYHQTGTDKMDARPIMYKSKEVDKIVLDEIDRAVKEMLGL